MDRELLSDEWDERTLQDAAVDIGIHDSIKDENLCGTMSTNPSPHVKFQWLLWLPFSLCRLIDLPVARSPVLL